MCAKKRWRNKKASFVSPSTKELQIKKATSFLHTHCALYLENEEKTNKKKYREMFSYQFVAHMPKIRQI